MNTFKKYTWMTFLAAAFWSCDLDRFPESDLTDAVYWQTENDFEQAANYLYRASHREWYDEDYQLYADNMSDNAVGLAFNPVSNGTFLPTGNGTFMTDQIYQTWADNYTLIRAANKILEKAEETGISESLVRVSLAEARYFRAYGYFDLVRRYGDVPLILKTLDTDDAELFSARTAREVVLDQVYEDLDYAADNLPLRSEGVDYGRVSSGTAMAMKSRVGLYEGTRLKYHGTGNINHDEDYHLGIARAAALEVMNSGEYSLFDAYGVDSYDVLFKGEGEGSSNPETMWAYIYGFNMENSVNIIYTSQQVSNGELAATRSLVDDYLCTDGLPIDQSPLYQGQQNVSSEFQDRDPRLDGTIVKPGDMYFLDNVAYTPQIVALTGYHVEKFFEIDNQRHLDLMIMRYAEVLLNYAEATYELNGTITDSELNASINLLRARVQMPSLTNAFVTANGLNMKEEIRRERRVELAMEGFRYDDLIRWKTAEDLLPQAIKGVRFFNAEYTSITPSELNLDGDSVIIVEPASNRTFDATKHYLWPLPLNEISLNENLVQNPNWD